MTNNKESVFWYETNNATSTSYENLIDKLNKAKEADIYCYTADYYSVFENILLAILNGHSITLLDADFSKEEIEQNIESYERLSDKRVVSFSKISDKEDLISRLNDVSSDFNLSLFTSGTTGRPKQITHDFASLTRAVRKSDKSVGNVWGFAYNPTHFAGLQVFFQALLNGNSLIRLFGTSKEQFIKLVEEYQISHISATPTFYRLLLPANTALTSVRRITFGGEKFDAKTRVGLEKLFPNAKFLNVYASTEGGTLFATENGNVFSIKSDLVDKIKIEESELFIHASLLGNSSSFLLKDGWFASGDLVEILTENPLTFSFKSRKNEMINVGGYKVNPHEVEAALSEMEGVKDVLVFAKANSVLGNIICCNLVVSGEKEVSVKSVRDFLSGKLQAFKIPRIIKFVETIDKTRTGKKQRK